MSDHDSSTRVCRDCKECKPLSDFGKDSSKKDGINLRCKACVSARAKAYADANKAMVSAKKRVYRSKPETKEKEAASHRAYRELNKDALKEKRIEQYHQRTPEQKERKRELNREYWSRNVDDIAERRRNKVWTPEQKEQSRLSHQKWYQENREHVLARAKVHYIENREAIIIRVRQYERANTDKVRLLGRVKAHRRRMRLVAAGGRPYTRQDVERLYALQKGCCAACRKKLKGKYHIDHRMPVAKGGDNTAGNIELLCPNCNHRKSDKLPHEFAQENGRLL